MNDIKVKLLNSNAALPERQHNGDAGADLKACIDELIPVKPGETVLIPTGLAIEIPYGFVGLVHPRSGMSVKTKLRIPNSPGTIDCAYRGEMMVPLHNVGAEIEIVYPGAKIAQLLIQRVELPAFAVVDELSDTKRGKGGFGSTGA